jgi:apolipoprotein N-acyltransferase
VAIVQGNSPCPGSRCPDERRLIYESHLALTATIAPGSVELVVWPESSTGFSTDPTANADIAAAIGDQARRIGAYLLVGGDRADGPDAFINSNVVFAPDGEMVGEYVKNHPVPFGEYVPFRPLVEWVPAIDRIPRDARAGEGPVRFDLEIGPVGSVISYEGAFARYERAVVREGAELLVVATNEASYGRSPASDQFLAISRVRAAEFGTDVVQGAITGRSAVVRANGPLTGPTDLFTDEVLYGEVRLRTAGQTLYTMAGDWLQVLAILALGAHLLLAGRELRPQEEGHPGGWPSFTGPGT